MSGNKGNTNNTDNTGNIITWIIIIILMLIPVTAPIGWIWLLVKLGIFGAGKVKGNKVKGNNVKQTRLEKKTGRGLAAFLLFVSIVLFIVGAVSSINALTSPTLLSLAGLAGLGTGMLWLLGGFISFFSRNIVSHRFSRYKNYNAFIGGRDIVPLSDIAQVGGVSSKVVIKDLQAMINNGYLVQGAYIDNELECLVLSPEAAEKLRTEIRGAPSPVLTQPSDSTASVSQYESSLAELRDVKSLINDEAISMKVSRLEELTAKIFKIVEDTPEKQPQIRRFMSYYLPTTLKLVRSYATLEQQGVKGENIMSTKKSIGDILDTLSTGYEQQLDQLFKSDAIDIASDINVLENLMQQDGLTSDKSEFQVAQSGGF